MPQNILYYGVNGETEAEEVEVDATSADRDEDNASLVAERIHQFTTDIFNLSGEEEGENDDVVVVENVSNSNSADIEPDYWS